MTNDDVDAAWVVRTFHERMQARDWAGAGRLLAESVVVDYIATGERFTGPAFLAMNRAYPDGWHIDVVETFADGSRAAARVRVTFGEHVDWCSGYYTVAGGVITSGVEHWVTAGAEAPPDWRRAYRTAD